MLIGIEHVIAKAIVKKAQTKSIPIKSTEKFQAISGKGEKAIVNGKNVFVGNAALMRDINSALSAIKRSFQS